MLSKIFAYDNPMFMIDSTYLPFTFTTVGNNDAYTPAYLIWQNIQGIANTMMILVLVLIIFSQLTGYGIDNYGIKKMLPKLILMAVLINLSYVICVLAVDLSNVIGHGIKDFCLSTKSTVLAQVGADDVEVMFATFFAILFGAGAGAGAAVGTFGSAFAATSASVLWLPLLIVALIGLIAIFIFFVILAIRNLLVIILVVISPLAFVCYILPNTQTLFNKWLSLFKSMLIIYPVCAGIYGLSLLIQAITFANGSGGALMMMVAILFTFVPFFAAPSLIKKSINAVGNLGASISNIGNKMKNGVRAGGDKIKNTDRYQNSLRNSAARRAENKANKFKAAREKAAEKAEKLSGRSDLNFLQRRRLRGFENKATQADRLYAKNRQAVEAFNKENVEGARIAMREETGNYDADIMGAQLNDLMDSADAGTLSANGENKMYALLSQLAAQKGGASQIRKAFRNRSGKSAQLVGGYMAANDGVRNAFKSKSERGASRVADISSGIIAANTKQEDYDKMNYQYIQYLRQQKASGNEALKENEWRAEMAKQGLSINEESVLQHIASDTLDKDSEFMSQSGEDVNALLGALKTTAGGQARIDRMASDPLLYSRGDISQDVRDAIARNATPPEKDKGKSYTTKDGRTFWVRPKE